MLDNEPTTATNDSASPDAAPEASAAVKKAAKKTTAKKTTKKAAAKKTTAKKATAKKAAAKKTTEPADSAASASESADAAAPAAKQATAKKAAAKKTTAKKSTAKKTAAKKAAAGSAGEAADAPTIADVASTDADQTPARRRSSRKAALAPAFAPPPTVSADAVEEDDEAAAEAALAAEAAAAVPDVLFQPPAPARSRARRAKAAATEAPDTDAEAPGEAEGVADADGNEDATTEGEAGEETTGTRRRRRRGGRGRRGRGGDGESEAAGDAAAVGEASDEESEAGSGSEGDEDEGGDGSRRRRRRRRRRGEGDDSSADESGTSGGGSGRSRSRSDEPQGIKGSVRIEAKRQRRREGREAGRRRPPVLTEAEFLARRESVERVMVVRQVGDRTQIAVLEDGVLVEHHVSRETTGSMIGNVYLGRVQNVLPSMEAAFIDIGRGRNAVLYAGEVNWDAAGLEGQPKRIEVALKSGDSVLVQVTKDPVGHKGARLTSQVSLPGRYLVYVPDGSMTGISRKLPDTERSRLKGILKRVLPENAGVIVRTASEGASEEELSRDVARLAAQWDDIKAKSTTASAPSLLYGEPDLTVRVIRDIFNEDFAKLVVSGADAWETVEPYVGHVAPDLADRLERWTSEKDVWSEYRVDEQLAKALDRKVWLPSGGSLVIDRTEAMTVIDVNTGKFTGQGGNLEQTVTENNIEAAEEIVRQLRLRDIGGIIVIDFIDMVLESNRELVLRRLIECLGRDRTKHQVAEVTSLGLVQMTRKRVGQGLLEVFSTTCESCNGRGVHVHMEPVEDKRRGGDGGRERSGKDGKDGKSTKGSKGSKDGKRGRSAKGSDAAAETEPAAAADAETGAETGPEAAAAPRSRRGSRATTAAQEAEESAPAGPAPDLPAATDAPASTEGSDGGAATEASRPTFVLAPRGVDLGAELPPATTPKRKRRAASRPAGAPAPGGPA